MNHENQLEGLRLKLKKIEQQIAQNWLGKWAKSIQINKIKDQIKELEKETKKPNND